MNLICGKMERDLQGLLLLWDIKATVIYYYDLHVGWEKNYEQRPYYKTSQYNNMHAYIQLQFSVNSHGLKSGTNNAE